jgi:hypothetical protein
LVELVDKTYQELKKADEKVKVIHAFSQLEIGVDFEVNTIQIMDSRTKEIFDLYDFNETCPNFYTRKELDNHVIYNSFKLIKKLKPKLF